MATSEGPRHDDFCDACHVAAPTQIVMLGPTFFAPALRALYGAGGCSAGPSVALAAIS